MCSVFIIDALRLDLCNINCFREFFREDMTYSSKTTSHQVQDPVCPCSSREDHQPSWWPSLHIHWADGKKGGRDTREEWLEFKAFSVFSHHHGNLISNSPLPERLPFLLSADAEFLSHWPFCPHWILALVSSDQSCLNGDAQTDLDQISMQL